MLVYSTKIGKIDRVFLTEDVELDAYILCVEYNVLMNNKYEHYITWEFMSFIELI